MKALFIGYHVDDNELGAGATINKYCETHKVHYWALSDCGLEDECRASCERLGIKDYNITIGRYNNRSADRQHVLDWLMQGERNFDVVFTHSSTDTHQMHQILHQEAFRAFKHTTIYGYNFPWNQREFKVNRFEKITANNLMAKSEALSCYKSQAQRPYMDHQFIDSWARVNGIMCGTSFAEGFEIINSVVN